MLKEAFGGAESVAFFALLHCEEKRIVNGKHVRLNVCSVAACTWNCSFIAGRKCCANSILHTKELFHKNAQPEPPEVSKHSRTIISCFAVHIGRGEFRLVLKGRMPMRILANLAIQLYVICLALLVLFFLSRYRRHSPTRYLQAAVRVAIREPATKTL